jgi:hypothetical protein
MPLNQVGLSELQLYERLRELPVVVYEQILPFVLAETGVTRCTYYNVLKGVSQNLLVLQAIARYLNTSLDAVLDPTYTFKDPRRGHETVEELAHQLGFTK